MEGRRAGYIVPVTTVGAGEVDSPRQTPPQAEQEHSPLIIRSLSPKKKVIFRERSSSSKGKELEKGKRETTEKRRGREERKEDGKTDGAVRSSKEKTQT